MKNLKATNLDLFPHSLTDREGMEFGLAHTRTASRLAVLANSPMLDFDGERTEFGERTLIMCARTPKNCAVLRSHLDWLLTRPLELKPSAGLGDRIGLATPGHVRAVR